MRRSAVLMTVLLSLFMFQSIWNVAAAYCGHENTSKQLIATVNHFGHHSLDDTQEQSNLKQDLADDTTLLSSQDHHDHLPSCFHVVVLAAEQQLNQPILYEHELKQQYDWSNFYQSPYLTGLNPPPVLTPL